MAFICTLVIRGGKMPATVELTSKIAELLGELVPIPILPFGFIRIHSLKPYKFVANRKGSVLLQRINGLGSFNRPEKNNNLWLKSELPIEISGPSSVLNPLIVNFWSGALVPMPTFPPLKDILVPEESH